jgi:hypothetical protein
LMSHDYSHASRRPSAHLYHGDTAAFIRRRREYAFFARDRLRRADLMIAR